MNAFESQSWWQKLTLNQIFFPGELFIGLGNEMNDEDDMNDDANGAHSHLRIQWHTKANKKKTRNLFHGFFNDYFPFLFFFFFYALFSFFEFSIFDTRDAFWDSLNCVSAITLQVFFLRNYTVSFSIFLVAIDQRNSWFYERDINWTVCRKKKCTWANE